MHDTNFRIERLAEALNDATKRMETMKDYSNKQDVVIEKLREQRDSYKRVADERRTEEEVSLLYFCLFRVNERLKRSSECGVEGFDVSVVLWEGEGKGGGSANMIKSIEGYWNIFWLPRRLVYYAYSNRVAYDRIRSYWSHVRFLRQFVLC